MKIPELKPLHKDSKNIFLSLILIHLTSIFIVGALMSIFIVLTLQNFSPANIPDWYVPASMIVSIIFSQFIVFFVLAKLYHIKVGKMFYIDEMKNKLTGEKLMSVFLFATGMSFFITILTNLILSFVKMVFSIKGALDPLENLNIANSSSIYLYFIAIAILGPIVEEFIFRGVIITILKKYGDAFAVIVSSILFSLLHANLIQIPSAFFIGLLYGYLTVKTGSLYYSTILHIMNNTLAMVPYIFKNIPYIDIILIAIMFALFLFSLTNLKAFKNEFISFYNEDEYYIERLNENTILSIERVNVTKNTLYKNFFIRAFSIIFLIITFFITITSFFTYK